MLGEPKVGWIADEAFTTSDSFEKVDPLGTADITGN